ncbi:MAG: replication factor C large subunit [Candidatus Aenigmatarchaeota archaeon]
MNLLEKYRPKKLADVIGNRKQIEETLEYIKKYKKGKALLIYGPSGCGKNLVIELIANELSYELIELSPSDLRDYENIKKTVLESAKQKSLFNKGKIILIDEIDTMDQGMNKGLVELIKESPFPVVLITTNPFEKRALTIRQHSKLIRFDKIRSDSLKAFLEKVAKSEGIKYEDRALSQLSRFANGDIRAALIDLQVLGEVTENSIRDFSTRNLEQSVFETLRIIFKTKEIENAKIALSQSDKTPEEIFWWLEENIFREYSRPEDIASGYKYLADADFFQSLIIKRQAWGLEKYFIDALSLISIAKSEAYKKFVLYQSPKFFVEIKKPKDLLTSCEKIGRLTHCSKKVAMEYLPLLKAMIKKNKKIGEEFTKEELDAVRGF